MQLIRVHLQAHRLSGTYLCYTVYKTQKTKKNNRAILKSPGFFSAELSFSSRGDFSSYKEFKSLMNKYVTEQRKSILQNILRN